MKKFDYYLSKNDENVPENYIPLTKILTDKNYAIKGFDGEKIVLGIKSVDSMRKKMFSETKKIFVAANLKKFSSFWNGNIDAINNSGFNEFYKMSFFRDLSSVIICFEIIKQSVQKRPNRIISFGISKKNYETYVQKLNQAIEINDKSFSFKMNDPYKRKKNDMFSFKDATIQIGENTITLKKNQIYNKFEKWAKLKGKTKQQAIYEAIQLLMEKDPVEKEDLNNIIVPNSNFSSMNNIITVRQEGETSVTVRIPNQLYDTANNVIRRYNSDPSKISKDRLSMSAYVSQAIVEYNKKVPLKYIDPVAYREYMKIKLSEKYNSKK